MTSLRRIGLGVGLASVLGALGSGAGAFAQGPDPLNGPAGGLARSIGVPGGMSFTMVLMSPAVQDELKLTTDQKTRIFDLARGLQQKGQERFQAMLQSGNPQAFLAAGQQIRRENETAAAKILDPEQKDRADQIMLQIEGPLAVARPEIAAKLNMTPKQIQQAQLTLMQMGQAVREMMVGQAVAARRSGLSPVGLSREAMNQLRAAATKQLSRTLDAKQKFNFNKLLGEPFDLSKIDPEFARPDPPATAGTGVGPDRSGTPKSRRKGAGAARVPAAKAEVTEPTPGEGVTPMP